MQFTIVNTLNDLRQLSTKNFSLVQTLGGATVGDGNASLYRSNLGDTRADNGSTIIAPVDNLGRWNDLTEMFYGTFSGVSILQSFTNSLGADVLLNNIANYFDGPSVAQGTSGVWFASTTVTLTDTASQASFSLKLWDGTTIIASAFTNNVAANAATTLSASGIISSPAGNIKVSVKDNTAVTGRILFNQSGNSKDSTLTVVRIG